VNKTPVRFTYTFTGKDIEEINEVRKQISEALFDEKGILNPAPLTVKEKIFKLLNKKRLPYVDDKFRNLIRHAEEYQSTLDPEVLQKETEKPNFMVYLGPIAKIPTVKEDFRNWTEEGQRKIELEMLEIRAMKEELVLKIKHKARISKITRPELICLMCKSTICAYFNVIPVEVNPVSGKFKLNCIFGSIRYEQELSEGMGGAEFLNSLSLTNEVIGIEEWGCCMEGHLVGWKAGGACYVSHKSPVSVLMPSGEEMPWGSYLWQEGYNEFLSTCKASEVSLNSKTAPKRDLTCEICQTAYETATELFNHVIVSKEHTDNVTRFLREGY